MTRQDMLFFATNTLKHHGKTGAPQPNLREIGLQTSDTFAMTSWVFSSLECFRSI